MALAIVFFAKPFYVSLRDPSTLTVFHLYKRLGFYPANELASLFYQRLDDLYHRIRKTSWGNEISRTRYFEILDFGSKTQSQTDLAIYAYQNKRVDLYKELLDSDNNIIGIQFHGQLPDSFQSLKDRIFLLKTTVPEADFLFENRLSNSFLSWREGTTRARAIELHFAR